MTAAPTLQARIRCVSHEAEGILGFELQPLASGTLLPRFMAGAHVDLHLPNGLIRSYSLLNDPAEMHRYCIAVSRDASSRGGSRHLHENLRPGDVLTISAPRNNFPLDEAAACSVFMAGGIGITPMLSMIARCRTLGMPWRLYYAARTRQHAGFVDQLRAWSAPGQLTLHFDDEAAGHRLDLAAAVAALPAGGHVYGCGPLPMLAAYDQATAGLPPARVHKEYFAAREQAATDGGYAVRLARSGRLLQVKPGHTLLDCLIEAGMEPLYSCREGICGTCEVRVLDGVPDHRDLVLSSQEQRANDRMMACCSGARSARLVLDL